MSEHEAEHILNVEEARIASEGLVGSGDGGPLKITDSGEEVTS